MNKTNIEWSDMTWNPATGCYHGCDYCYAKRITHRFGGHSIAENCGIAPSCEIDDCKHCNEYKQIKRVHELDKREYIFNPKRADAFPYGFEPTFHRYRLREPGKRKKPAKIFVSSMGDLFGEWIPDEWIEEVLKVVRQCPQHTFQFLTKNPNRYYKWFGYDIEDIPENVWIGASADNRTDAHIRTEILQFMKEGIRFLSLEPLLEDVSEYIEWEGFDWLIIGGQTGPGAKETKTEWVENAISYARAYRIPVFLKNNLNWPEEIQEWPEGVK